MSDDREALKSRQSRQASTWLVAVARVVGEIFTELGRKTAVGVVNARMTCAELTRLVKREAAELYRRRRTAAAPGQP